MIVRRIGDDEAGDDEEKIAGMRKFAERGALLEPSPTTWCRGRLTSRRARRSPAGYGAGEERCAAVAVAEVGAAPGTEERADGRADERAPGAPLAGPVPEPARPPEATRRRRCRAKLSPVERRLIGFSDGEREGCAEAAERRHRAATSARIAQRSHEQDGGGDDSADEPPTPTGGTEEIAQHPIAVEHEEREEPDDGAGEASGARSTAHRRCRTACLSADRATPTATRDLRSPSSGHPERAADREVVDEPAQPRQTAKEWS